VRGERHCWASWRLKNKVCKLTERKKELERVRTSLQPNQSMPPDNDREGLSLVEHRYLIQNLLLQVLLMQLLSQLPSAMMTREENRRAEQHTTISQSSMETGSTSTLVAACTLGTSRTMT
jgi:hypothetical protein